MQNISGLDEIRSYAYGSQDADLLSFVYQIDIDDDKYSNRGNQHGHGGENYINTDEAVGDGSHFSTDNSHAGLILRTNSQNFPVSFFILVFQVGRNQHLSTGRGHARSC